MNKKLSLFTVLLAGTFLTSSVRAADYGITVSDFNTPGITWQESNEQPEQWYSPQIYLRDINGEMRGFVGTFDEPLDEGSFVGWTDVQTTEEPVNVVGNYGHNDTGGGAYNQYDRSDVTLNVNALSNGAVSSGGFLFNRHYEEPWAAVAQSVIGTINGNIANNAAPSGGAIFNDWNATINTISGNFIGNAATYVMPAQESVDEIDSAYGGFLCNNGIIEKINGNLIGNYAEASLEASGGAVYTGSRVGNQVMAEAYNFINSDGEIVKTLYEVYDGDNDLLSEDLENGNYNIVMTNRTYNEYIGDEDVDDYIHNNHS